MDAGQTPGCQTPGCGAPGGDALAARDAPGLLALPTEILVRVVSLLPAPEDVARAAICCKALSAPGPAAASVVEQALRRRAARAQRALPPRLPAEESSWTQFLLWDERRARVHDDRAAAAARVACSSTHSLTVDPEGRVASFGSGLFGCLGHGDEAPRLEPRLIRALSHVRAVAVAAGRYHSLVLGADGRVYSFGEGRGGKLGHGGCEDQWEPKVVEGLADVHVAAVAAGDDHSVCLGADGSVYSFGRAKGGCLGHGVKHSQDVPKRVACLRGLRVAAAACGPDRTALVADGGALYMCGDGRAGALGHGGYAPCFFPVFIEVPGGSRVRVVALGAWHTLVAAEDGTVYAFGQAHSALGLRPGDVGPAPRAGPGYGLGPGAGPDSMEDVLVPTAVSALRGRRVVAVAAGDTHSAVLADDGTVLTFGLRTGGQLGRADGGEAPAPVPGFGPAPGQARAVAVAASMGVTFVVGETPGTEQEHARTALFSFGCGDDGRAGLGHQGDTLLPARLTIGIPSKLTAPGGRR